jgi:hypothetical protein
MAERSDFKHIRVHKQIGDDPPFFPNIQQVGTSLTETFTAGAGVADGYILLQVFGVQGIRARIRINNQDLPGVDIQPSVTAPPANMYWYTWWDFIPDGILHQGQNTLEIRAGGLTGGSGPPFDDIVIEDVVIHYRESD